ncbi:hypothetical protein EPA93_31875 [Ktedonosporobacter rubrisoli]|uniref:Uncharacterized protein n=1 Tax=Ktedonosporobacter rubrisoli TaxID=2509675 RepID=A0A4P6JY00_KTERU|nr:hypothetical protein [Ktedonosporobacter rubrisoli]QBD80323.1 hypothetical protein EPA93_31875 [Ktedonosporobacter rubrisoli]
MADTSEQKATAQEPATVEVKLRPPTRVELRNLWLKEYGEQDVALQLWVTLVEKENLEVAIMLQMHSLLVFGTMVPTQAYVQFHLDLFDQTYREQDPAMASELHKYYSALIPPADQPEIGPEGLPTMWRYIHLRDVTIIGGEHTVKYHYWRGKVSGVDAFVIGVAPEEE